MVRLSDMTRSNNLILTLRRNQAAMNRLSEEISSGKRIISASDDPAAYSMLLRLKDASSLNDGYLSNIQQSRSELELKENMLDEVSEVALQLKTLAQKASNDANYTDSRDVYLQTADKLLESLVSLGNTNLTGTYMFSGSQVLTKPFEVTRDGNGIASVEYKGDNLPTVINPNSQERMEISLSGQSIFMGKAGMGEDIFQAVINFKNDLQADKLNNPDDHIDNFNGMYNRVVGKRAELGSNVEHLDRLEDFLTNYNYSIDEKSSEIESVDMAEAITQYLNIENVYKASLEVASRINNLSLLDYLQ